MTAGDSARGGIVVATRVRGTGDLGPLRRGERRGRLPPMADTPDSGDAFAGRELWEIVSQRMAEKRSRGGRPPSFSSPEELWQRCEAYFRWAEANPLWEDRVYVYEGRSWHEPLAKKRVFTVQAMCLFVGISRETWNQYRRKPAFSDVINRVDEAIRTNKFEGAAAGLYNPHIIARDLGLKDRRETDGNFTVRTIADVMAGEGDADEGNDA